MTTPITLTKKYRLRGYPGAEVEVLKTDMGGELPVLARHKNPDGTWAVIQAMANGQFDPLDDDGDNPYDLIEVPARVRIEGFVNVYREQPGDFKLEAFKTEELARHWRSNNCIACIPPSRLADFEEGEGL